MVEEAASKNAGQPASGTPPASSSSPGRLWTPWRMRYVAGGTRERGCVFCNRLAEEDDERTLILHRGERVFVIMNLFPYNTGHVMIVPRAHVASPEDADPETIAEMAALRAPVLRALRRALAPAGFNLGLNVGSVAGAGVVDHLHEHVVPRWEGDANFMPILASTMVMPELIPVTYAKLRAELARELGASDQVISIVLSDDGTQVLVTDQGALPRVDAEEGEPIWRAALRDAHGRGAVDAEVIAWAGEHQAGPGPTALLMRADLTGGHREAGEPSHAGIDSPRSASDAALVRSVLDRLDPGE